MKKISVIVVLLSVFIFGNAFSQTRPVGNLEEVTLTGIKGWAYDKDAGTNPTSIQIMVNGTAKATVIANVSRADLVTANVAPNPEHGFNYPTSSLGLAPGSYTISINALDYPENVSVPLLWTGGDLIPSKTLTVTGTTTPITRTLTFAWEQDLNLTATLQWQAGENAVKYELRVHEDGTPAEPCSSLAFCGDVTGLEKSVVLKPGTKYDWRVRGISSSGVVGPFSESTFTTAAFSGWNLYQASQAGGPYTLLATIPFAGSQATYQTLQSIVVPDGQKTTLYFALAAFNSIGESTKSAEVVAVIDLTSLTPGPLEGLGVGSTTIPITPFTLKAIVTTP